MSNLPQSLPTYRQNLRILKQLWISGTSEQAINEAIWSFVNKLPVQYQKSILQYCFSNDFPNGSNAFSNASYMFKNIDCAQALQKKISQFSHFCNNETEVNEQQLGVVMYNLAWMLQKIGMNSKAQRIIKDNKHLTNLNKKLAVKIWLKNEKFTRRKQKIQSEEIKRFVKIKYTQQNLQYILSLNTLTIHEVYNIALSLKLNKRYRKTILLMERIGNTVKKQDSLHALSKINISQCYFNLGQTLKAIQIITELMGSNNFYIIPYRKELNTKIFLWSKSNQVLELSRKYNFQNVASKLIINNSQQKAKEFKQSTINRFSTDNNRTKNESKILLKNRKLLFLEQKFLELDELKTQETSNQKTLNDLSFKNSSLRFYKCSSKMKLFGSKLLRQLSNQTDNHLDENRCQMNNKKKLKRGISRFEELKSYVLISHAHSEKNTQINSIPPTQSNATLKWEHENYIDHHWTVIKNSKDQAQIAQKYLSLGDLYTEEKEFQNALLCYKKALEKGRYEAYGRIGDLFYNKGKSQASQYFQKYLKFVDESNNKIRLKLLHCYSKNPWKYKKASQQLEQFITENPYDTQAHILYTTVLMKLKNYSKAIQQCQKLKKINYMCYQNHHILGLLYRIINKNREAFDSFINALRINPLDVSSLMQITFLTQISDFLPQLIAIYRKALSGNKKNHEIIQILKFLIDKKKLQWEQIKPKLNFSELIAIGDSFLANQMLEEAQISYKEAAEYTNNILLKQKLGNLQYLKQNYAQAQRYYRESQKRKPNIKIQVKLGYTLMKQNKFKQALAIFQDCLTNDSQDRKIYFNFLGQCEFKLGNYEKALQRFRSLKKFGEEKQIIQNWQILCKQKINEEKNRMKIKQ